MSIELPKWVDGALNGLDLFSGIGGNTLGLRDYVNTIAYCEEDRHAQAVLLSRMSEGEIKPAPIWNDVTTLKGSMFDQQMDIIIGGFPCQDISVAGNGRGLEGERSGLFYEVCRLVKEIKPSFVFLENVPAIRTRGLREVIREFTNMGYDCRWTCVSAAEVGAPHLRKRWFLLAHTIGSGDRTQPKTMVREKEKGQSDRTMSLSSCGTDTTRRPDMQHRGQLQATNWEVEPSVGRMVDGLPLRVDRIKRLGNAVVPLQAKTAFKRLMGL